MLATPVAGLAPSGGSGATLPSPLLGQPEGQWGAVPEDTFPSKCSLFNSGAQGKGEPPNLLLSMGFYS